MKLAILFAAVASQAASLPPVVQTPPPPPPPGVHTHDDWDDETRANRENCPVPRPSAGERFILLGFYEGSAVADRSVAGLEKETTSGTINILPGRGRIFLVLTSFDPVIFRLTGNVDRISRVVVLHREGGGVTGVGAAQASFGIGENCAIGYDTERSSSVAKMATQIFGRPPDKVGGDYELDEWMLPGEYAGNAVSIRHRRSEPQGTALENERDRFYPGGVVTIDPKTLISSRTAERYRVLPSTAGAVQLEQEGKIVPATREELDAWKERAEQRYGKKAVASVSTYGTYRVVKPIELPIGLCGAHQLSFLVPSEDYFQGDPCHGDIFAIDGRILTPHRQRQLRVND